jgi:hypothetical protein
LPANLDHHVHGQPKREPLDWRADCIAHQIKAPKVLKRTPLSVRPYAGGIQ